MAIEQKKKNYQDLNIAVGKTQPSAVDMEEAVLGALMLEKDAIEVVLDILKPEAFYRPEHQKIYSVIKELASAGNVVDLLTVTNELRNRGWIAEIGGAGYIAHLSNKIASAAHIDFHARVIAQKHIQRELIRVTSDIQRQAFDNTLDVYDLLNKSEQELFDISAGVIKKEILPISPILDDALQRIQEAKHKDFSGVPSGFPSIDKITQGWQKGDLVIVAARPSMGKTAFTLSMTRNMAVDHHQAVAFFSLEMPSVQLVNRLIVSETEIDHNKIKSGKLDDKEWEHLEDKLERLYQSKIYIDDSPSLSIFDLMAKCRRLKAKQQLDIVVIDYLQLMKGDSSNGNREQEVSQISRSLKQMAKDLDIPVIALAQLNRGVELRSNSQKRPMLADLRESGAIEQDADIIAFINRPERMGIFEDENGQSTKGRAEIIIAKHRNGETADVLLKFRHEFARFEEYESEGGYIKESPQVLQKFASKMNDEVTSEDPISNFENEDSFNTDNRFSPF
ncbi:MAG: replicative DNA helicase [Bacteroidales bacterium]|nr:replicative DNA helicase [Bacteroidales bacterium]